LETIEKKLNNPNFDSEMSEIEDEASLSKAVSSGILEKKNLA
jgi:hypothetical protein